MNAEDSTRYKEIDRSNLNRPVADLVCPRCEQKTVVRDKETSDHPGVFCCTNCNCGILA